MADLFLALSLASLVGLIVGLAKPSIFTRIAKREFTRKQIGLFFGGALVLFFVLTGITADRKESTLTPESEPEQEGVEITTEAENEVEIDGPEAEPESEPEPEPEPTIGEKNALRSALDYLDYTAFSYSGLITQLEYEGFTHQQAVYGADNCEADWNGQAARTAKDYLDYSAFSRDGLIEQLEYEGFTHQQAVYGAEAVGY